MVDGGFNQGSRGLPGERVHLSTQTYVLSCEKSVLGSNLHFTSADAGTVQHRRKSRNRRRELDITISISFCRRSNRAHGPELFRPHVLSCPRGVTECTESRTALNGLETGRNDRRTHV